MTLLMYLSYYFFSRSLDIRPAHQKLIFAGILTCSQIILTEMILGLAGCLYLPWLVLVNALMTSGVFIYAFFCNKERLIPFKREGQLLLNGAKNALSLANMLLLALGGFVFLWMAAAVYCLPPRTSDDAVYHLPAIYEYILNHKIFLLPVTMDGHFAFPQNAELLFMWPAIFSHSQQFVEVIQVIVAFWGVTIVYGLARAVDTAPKTSLFVALLSLFTPVVLAQMGSNYIDVVTGIFFLATLYWAVMFYKTSRCIFFYAMALAGGLVWGMRYDSMVLFFTLFPFIFKGYRSLSRKHWIGSITVFLIAGGYWYFRNFLLLKTPVYPLDLVQRGLGIFNSKFTSPNMAEVFHDIGPKLRALWKDAGLGSLHGGYGLAFWGVALPAWLYIFVRSLVRRDRLSLFLSLPLMVGVAKLMPVPLKCFQFTGRYSLFIVALALVSLGQVLTIFSKEVFFGRSVKFVCIAFAMLSVVHLSAVNYPDYLLEEPVKNLITDPFATDGCYAGAFPKSLVKAWVLLDYLTLNDPHGLSCYVAMRKEGTCFPADKTWVSPLYGTHLQNRVWNLQRDRSLPPDAFLYFGPLDQLHYFGDTITPQKVKVDPDYALVMQGGMPPVLVFLNKRILRDINIQRRLQEALGGIR